jgi:hypothetical protein
MGFGWLNGLLSADSFAKEFRTVSLHYDAFHFMNVSVRGDKSKMK